MILLTTHWHSIKSDKSWPSCPRGQNSAKIKAKTWSSIYGRLFLVTSPVLARCLKVLILQEFSGAYDEIRNPTSLCCGDLGIVQLLNFQS